VSHAYKAVGWNRQKHIYDRVLLGSVLAFLALVMAVGSAVNPAATAETLLIRAFGVAAFTLLHVILCIGPLCRMDSRFLPLLYNRRHMGVTMFGLALVHGVVSLVQFHTQGDVHPLVSLFQRTADAGLVWIPFQPLGFLALLILFLMAATSHDFWLANLSAPVWKALHMGVYLAYALLVAHVSLGVLQSERSPALAWIVAVGMGIVLVMHALAARRESPLDREHKGEEHSGYRDVCAVDDIAEGRAKVVTLEGRRVAVFRYDGKVSAVSNACQHQNGPLGEGRVIDGCITCPWHGYQYRPEDGCSPPPFTEKVPTYEVRVESGRVLVNPEANARGTAVEPAMLQEKQA
jgi:methionine sulfoxide reductase heme-binding subunit